MKNPTFTIYCGPMFATKTSHLLMELDRLKYQKVKTLVFKPVVDRRYEDTSIVSHTGWRHEAYPVEKGEDIFHVLDLQEERPITIVVDEAFMIPDIAKTLIFLFRNGFNVIVSTLDFAANGKPFPEVAKMLPWATKIEKCTAVCTVCGSDAHYTHKKNLNIDEFVVEIGGEELYEPRCAFHYPVLFDFGEIKNEKNVG